MQSNSNKFLDKNFVFVYSTFSHRMSGILGVFIPVSLFGFISLSIALSNRDVSLYGTRMASIIPGALEIVALQIGTIFTLLCALLLIGLQVINRSDSLVNKRNRIIVGTSFFAYWVAAKIAAGSFSDEIAYQDFYTLIIFSGVISIIVFEVNKIFIMLKYFLLVLNCVALIYLVIAPDVVNQIGYVDSVFFDFRYWGLTAHANNLGPQIVLLGTLILLFPFKRKSIQIFSCSVVILILVIAQSKTTIISIIGGYLLYRFVYSASSYRNSAKKANLRVFVILIFCSISSIILISLSDSYFLDEYFTGRGNVWQISMEIFLENPLFGGGVDVWSVSFADSFGYLGIASNSHNQVLDTLSSSGIFGYACFMVFLICLVYVFNPETVAGKAFAYLFLFLLLRGFTEVPFKLGVPMANDFAILIVVAMLAIFSQKQDSTNAAAISTY